jgi:hypothetical protein
MSFVEVTINFLRSHGMSDADVLAYLVEIERKTNIIRDSSAFSGDEQAERRRAADRDYQRRKREERNAAESAERLPTLPMSADAVSLPPDGPLSLPQTPTLSPLNPPNPSKNLVPGKPGRVVRKPDYEPEFEMLWSVFPHHPNASKLDAHRKWLALDPGDREACLDGAMRYADWLAAERKKRPEYPGLHLATFVHQRRWEAHLEAAE